MIVESKSRRRALGTRTCRASTRPQPHPVLLPHEQHSLPSLAHAIVMADPVTSAPTPAPTPAPVELEEFYSSWSLFLVCLLLILSLWTSYYLQIKRIRAVHETLVAIFAGMFVGLVVRLAPGTMIREMLVSTRFPVLTAARALQSADHVSSVSEEQTDMCRKCRHSSIHCSSTYYCRLSS